MDHSWLDLMSIHEFTARLESKNGHSSGDHWTEAEDAVLLVGLMQELDVLHVGVIDAVDEGVVAGGHSSFNMKSTLRPVMAVATRAADNDTLSVPTNRHGIPRRHPRA